MADGSTGNGYPGARRARRRDDELGYWSEKWQVSREDVKRAIRKVGPMVKDVARELGRA